MAPIIFSLFVKRRVACGGGRKPPSTEPPPLKQLDLKTRTIYLFERGIQGVSNERLSRKNVKKICPYFAFGLKNVRIKIVIIVLRNSLPE
jgi:hypothetical protein